MRWGLLVLLVASPAWAGPAVEAAAVQDAHCGQILGDDAALESGALSAVATTLGTVSQAHDATRKPFLLYWRGGLAQCIGHDDNARVDLLTSWNKTEDDASMAGQRDDAVRRLRMLGVTVRSGEGPGKPGVGIGVGLLAAGGVFAGLAGWQGSVLDRAELDHRAGDLLTTELAARRRRQRSPRVHQRQGSSSKRFTPNTTVP